MNQKTVRLSALILILVILASGLCSCSEQPDEPYHEMLNTASVSQKDNVIEYGNYVFYESGKGIMKYDRSTGEIRSACVDPECKGNCLLESPLNYFSQIVDGKLYFATMTAYTHEYTYAYLDIQTGIVTVLRICEEIESVMGIPPLVENGYCYYSCKKLKENGNKQDPQDYLPYICRISADGSGSEEVLCELLGESDILLFVYNGNAITHYDSKLHLVNLSTGERQIIFDQHKEGYTFVNGDLAFLNGKIYLLLKTNASVTSEYTKKSYKYSYLVCVDLETHTHKRVLETPVVSFHITNEKIYYAPFELRHLNLPEDYENNLSQITIMLASPDLHCCDLDGKNYQILYSNPTLNYMESFTVVQDKLYGWLIDHDEKTNTGNKKTYFGEIDFKTNEIIIK